MVLYNLDNCADIFIPIYPSSTFTTKFHSKNNPKTKNLKIQNNNNNKNPNKKKLNHANPNNNIIHLHHILHRYCTSTLPILI